MSSCSSSRASSRMEWSSIPGRASRAAVHCSRSGSGIRRLRVVRMLFHRRAALYLEGVGDAARSSQATTWRIADHWHAAGDRSEALKWRRACWRHLLSIGQPMAAADSIRSYLPNSVSDAERAALLDDLIHALQHASDAKGQLSALRDRSALSDRVGDGSATRVRLAADTAEARFLGHEDTTLLLPELQALLVSTELDEMRRLRAAKALMIAADSLLDEVTRTKGLRHDASAAALHCRVSIEGPGRSDLSCGLRRS